MTQYAIKVNSYLGSDTRIQIVKERSPKRELYIDSPLDRNCENKTALKKDEPSTAITGKTAHRTRTQNRLSSHARKTLQRIGGVASVHWRAESFAFLTGTFPGSSYAVQRAIASQCGWIVNTLKAWIYKRIGANVAYWVWEFQKRGTLHLHYVVVIPDERKRAAILADFQDEWLRLIKGASARSNQNLFMGEKGRDYFTEQEKIQIYAQECYKDCGSYLSKYLSKSKTSEFPAPCRLWGCTKEARNLVARHLISVEVCSKTLAAATEEAWKIDSYSNVEPEKRRYFRHRFSQGFTILLYDDAIRPLLVREDKTMEYDEKLRKSLVRLSNKLLLLECQVPVYERSSLPLKSRFDGYEPFFKTDGSPESLQALEMDLLELGSIIDVCPGLKHYHVNDLKNLIRASLWLVRNPSYRVPIAKEIL